MNKISVLKLLIILFSTGMLNSNAQTQRTVDFTIKAGSLVETVYLNASTKIDNSDLKSLSKKYEKQGAEVLAKFEVTNFPQESNVATEKRSFSHILMVQWTDPKSRTQKKSEIILSKIEKKIGKENLQFGFFASQQNTPVSLKTSKAYDFTSAWLISDKPCAAPALMQVINTYFGKIGAALQKYEIKNSAFIGPHPLMPTYETRLFVPHMLGIFEWREFSDRAKFIKDPLFAPHKDIRNSVLKKMDIVFTKVIL